MTDPFVKFRKWFSIVKKKKSEDPTAFALGTVDENLQPQVRMVLLKKIDNHGFTFFTNINSGKGKQFLRNKKLSMCFYWESIDRQIRITGEGEFIPDKDADEYFLSRARGSQIGAWASNQSSAMKSRKTFIKKVKFFEKKFKNNVVKRPKNWVGIKIKPKRFEFWKQGKFRMHQRTLFFLKSKKWCAKILFP